MPEELKLTPFVYWAQTVTQISLKVDLSNTKVRNYTFCLLHCAFKCIYLYVRVCRLHIQWYWCYRSSETMLTWIIDKVSIADYEYIFIWHHELHYIILHYNTFYFITNIYTFIYILILYVFNKLINWAECQHKFRRHGIEIPCARRRRPRFQRLRIRSRLLCRYRY